MRLFISHTCLNFGASPIGVLSKTFNCSHAWCGSSNDFCRVPLRLIGVRLRGSVFLCQNFFDMTTPFPRCGACTIRGNPTICCGSTRPRSSQTSVAIAGNGSWLTKVAASTESMDILAGRDVRALPAVVRVFTLLKVAVAHQTTPRLTFLS